MNETMDAEERDILSRFEMGELRPSPDAAREMKAAQEAARNTFNKTRRVNLRVTERDYMLAHTRAGKKEYPIRHCCPASSTSTCRAGWPRRGNGHPGAPPTAIPAKAGIHPWGAWEAPPHSPLWVPAPRFHEDKLRGHDDAPTVIPAPEQESIPVARGRPRPIPPSGYPRPRPTLPTTIPALEQESIPGARGRPHPIPPSGYPLPVSTRTSFAGTTAHQPSFLPPSRNPSPPSSIYARAPRSHGSTGSPRTGLIFPFALSLSKGPPSRSHGSTGSPRTGPPVREPPLRLSKGLNGCMLTTNGRPLLSQGWSGVYAGVVRGVYAAGYHGA